jgi:hypothetical protein
MATNTTWGPKITQALSMLNRMVSSGEGPSVETDAVVIDAHAAVASLEHQVAGLQMEIERAHEQRYADGLMAARREYAQAWVDATGQTLTEAEFTTEFLAQQVRRFLTQQIQRSLKENSTATLLERLQALIKTVEGTAEEKRQASEAAPEHSYVRGELRGEMYALMNTASNLCQIVVQHLIDEHAHEKNRKDKNRLDHKPSSSDYAALYFSSPVNVHAAGFHCSGDDAFCAIEMDNETLREWLDDHRSCQPKPRNHDGTVDLRALRKFAKYYRAVCRDRSFVVREQDVQNILVAVERLEQHDEKMEDVHLTVEQARLELHDDVWVPLMKHGQEELANKLDAIIDRLRVSFEEPLRQDDGEC